MAGSIVPNRIRGPARLSLRHIELDAVQPLLIVSSTANGVID